MKKLIYLIVIMLVLGLIISGCSLLGVTPVEKDEATILTKGKPDSKPGTDFSGPHFNLNIIGKKADWNAQGNFSNWDRHTIFVPECTDDWTTPNGEDGITIWMTQWNKDNLEENYGEDDFAVIDGNACDDGIARFQLKSGKYDVYIVAKAKPGKDRYTNITGWVYYEADKSYYFSIGELTVKKSKKWWNANDLFYVSYDENPFKIEIPIAKNGFGMWVFDYLGFLGGLEGITDTAYFWQYDNHGNKLVKVRFYPVEK